MSDLTITLEGSEVRADFFGTNAWLRNDGTSTIYAGRKPGVVSGAAGVVSVPAGGSAPVFDAHGTVYLIGAGSVLLIGSDYSENPFKSSAQGGSGADEVARAAIEAHAGNSAIHLTAEQINSIDGGKTVEKSSSHTIDNAVDYPLVDMRIYGKSTQDGVPTPDAPVDIVSVGDSGAVGVTACGKNLLNYDAWENVGIIGGTAIFENNGVTLTATKNDCFTRYLADDIHYPKAARIPIKEGETVTLSWQETDNKEGGIFIFPNGASEGRVLVDNKSSKTLSYTATAGISFITFRFGVANSGDTIYYKNIQIEKDSTATAYEPYVGSTANLTSALPLCGIPVSEGGNYTDSNGQQWIADEVIYNADGTGKDVKRTAKIDSYNGETVAEPYLSTMGSLTTGATVIYALNTPQEIDLTAAEMAQLQALQTFDGITNISNGGADMQIKYCTNKALSEYEKPVIDGLKKQIDELKTAVLSLGGNV